MQLEQVLRWAQKNRKFVYCVCSGQNIGPLHPQYAVDGRWRSRLLRRPAVRILTAINGTERFVPIDGEALREEQNIILAIVVDGGDRFKFHDESVFYRPWKRP